MDILRKSKASVSRVEWVWERVVGNEIWESTDEKEADFGKEVIESSEQGTEKMTAWKWSWGKSRQDRLEVIAVVEIKDGSLDQHSGEGGGEK